MPLFTWTVILQYPSFLFYPKIYFFDIHTHTSSMLVLLSLFLVGYGAAQTLTITALDNGIYIHSLYDVNTMLTIRWSPPVATVNLPIEADIWVTSYNSDETAYRIISAYAATLVAHCDETTLTPFQRCRWFPNCKRPVLRLAHQRSFRSCNRIRYPPFHLARART
jgi:hypothetical protein